jgi:hypothetical protein
MSKGKKNDHIFHNACLDEIVSFYQEKFIPDKKPPVTIVRTWTDNCAGQYKCKQNFYKVATFGERHDGVAQIHLFTQKYCFKGIWDGAGKIIKAFIRDSEVSSAQRFPDALACFIHFKDALKILKGRKDWEKLEAELDPKILDKATFTTSKRFFGLATDGKEQYEESRKVHEHIVFTDREKTPSIPRIEGTHKLHSVAGDPSSRKLSADGTATFKLTTREFPCDCLVCRKIFTDRECRFKHITKEQIHTVSEEVKGATRKRVDRTPEETELIRQLEELVCTKLWLEKLTVKNMQSACRERNITHTGKKLDMA